MNQNSFGLNPSEELSPALFVSANDSVSVRLPVEPNVNKSGQAPGTPLMIHTMVKCTLDVY